MRICADKPVRSSAVQFDGEKADKITRGACACNDDKVIARQMSRYKSGVTFHCSMPATALDNLNQP
jgi:hypothetical protein